MTAVTGQSPAPSELLPKDAPAAARAIADASPEDLKGTLESGSTEHDAAYWLLQPQVAPVYEADVKFETPSGTRTLVFTMQALAGTAIDEIERKFYNADPMKIDDMGMACSLVATALKSVKDKDTGSVVDLQALVPTGYTLADALKNRFTFQSGVMVSLANIARDISGWGPDRVGRANRVLVDLSGNS